jgi:superfamily I DNA/RNA helicase
MLLKGINHINKQNIKYLIVDEFQDISSLRAEVIKKIQKINQSVRLFTVGDDWQAIYRFSGGDAKIIVKKYEKFFGKRKMADLNTTYRFNNKLATLTSSFILKNKDGQLYKNIKGVGKYNKVPLEIFEQTTHRSFKIDFSLKKHLLTKLDEIFKSDKDVKKILFLARYRDYRYRNGYEDLKKYITNIFKNKTIIKDGKKEHIVQFSTIHSAKGSEADYVFLMNVSDGYMGFPSTIENDPLLKLVIEDIDEFEHEEERRLFYVALTRTKKKVFLYGKKEAYFIEEILNDKKIKKKDHYENSEIPISNNPDRILVFSFVKGNKKKIDPQTPAKNAGLEKDDIVTKVDSKTNPTKKDLNLALRDSNGNEISLHIKNKEGKIEEKKIKPYNEYKRIKVKKKWSINAKYYEMEIDPFIEKLMKDYSLDLNNKAQKMANLNNNN